LNAAYMHFVNASNDHPYARRRSYKEQVLQRRHCKWVLHPNEHTVEFVQRAAIRGSTVLCKSLRCKIARESGCRVRAATAGTAVALVGLVLMVSIEQ
jgi:hypothetical protein